MKLRTPQDINLLIADDECSVHKPYLGSVRVC